MFGNLLDVCVIANCTNLNIVEINLIFDVVFVEKLASGKDLT